MEFLRVDEFDKINDGTHQGDITITLIGNTIESATAELNASGIGSASYTSIDIYPTVTGLSISGNIAAPLIDLNGADNVTIDGRAITSSGLEQFTLQAEIQLMF
ncbi:MAG: hypothetical protein Q8880_03320 [Bacteroidota bacterium]|nr:hypothetical protein [Bacteroidota bacterium]